MVLGARKLYLLFDPAGCRKDPWHTLAAAMRGGVDLVQWRTKGQGNEALPTAMQMCAQAGVPLLVNDDQELARRSGAAGVHLGQEDGEFGPARLRLRDAWLGISTHNLAQLEQAHRSGADYVGFGPCFPTATKGYTAGLPSSLIAAAAQRADELGMPLFAIGGITPARALALREFGVRRVAVSRAILAAADPEAAAAAFR